MRHIFILTAVLVTVLLAQGCTRFEAALDYAREATHYQNLPGTHCRLYGSTQHCLVGGHGDSFCVTSTTTEYSHTSRTHRGGQAYLQCASKATGRWPEMHGHKGGGRVLTKEEMQQGGRKQ